MKILRDEWRSKNKEWKDFASLRSRDWCQGKDSESREMSGFWRWDPGEASSHPSENMIITKVNQMWPMSWMKYWSKADKKCENYFLKKYYLNWGDKLTLSADEAARVKLASPVVIRSKTQESKYWSTTAAYGNKQGGYFGWNNCFVLMEMKKVPHLLLLLWLEVIPGRYRVDQ